MARKTKQDAFRKFAELFAKHIGKPTPRMLEHLRAAFDSGVAWGRAEAAAELRDDAEAIILSTKPDK
jgi:hypothetical protein